jgi:hypothetical protein
LLGAYLPVGYVDALGMCFYYLDTAADDDFLNKLNLEYKVAAYHDS